MCKNCMNCAEIAATIERLNGAQIPICGECDTKLQVNGSIKPIAETVRRLSREMSHC